MSTKLEVGTRLKKARKYLNISQEYVGKLMGLTHSAISDIENGKRDVSAPELKRFSEIYGWSADEILNGKPSENSVMFARAFSDLREEDKEEIMNLIHFKKKLKENKVRNA